VLHHLETLRSEPLQAGLYLVATPIGNLGDITLRALAVLAGADIVYCEDTRKSRILMSHFGIAQRLRPYHEHNADEERPRVLAELAAGRTVALISDAGTPLVSDPGFKLVREALEGGHRVVSVPGPAAPIAALTSSGLPPDTFLFGGFLPAKSASRRTRLAGLAAVPATLIFFEAPNRVAETLADMADVLGSTRQGALARELTKIHEEVRRGTLGELASWAPTAGLKGECVLLAGPPLPAEVSDAQIASELAGLAGKMSVRDASREVAASLGVTRARVYDLAVRLKRETE
jgi:16S rRNA (cytidine1402-2'-O)-methyltransferase